VTAIRSGDCVIESAKPRVSPDRASEVRRCPEGSPFTGVIVDVEEREVPLEAILQFYGRSARD